MGSVQLSSALGVLSLQNAFLASASVVATLVINEGVRSLYQRVVASRLESAKDTQEASCPKKCRSKPVISRSVAVSALVLSGYIVAKIMQLAGFILAIPNFVTGSAVVAAGVMVYSALYPRSCAKPDKPSGPDKPTKASEEASNIYTLVSLKKELIDDEYILKLSPNETVTIKDNPPGFIRDISKVLDFLIIPEEMETKIKGDCIVLTAKADCELMGRYTSIELEALKEEVKSKNDGYLNNYNFRLKPDQELRVHLPIGVDLGGPDPKHVIDMVFLLTLNCMENPPAGVYMSVDVDSREFIFRNVTTEDRVLKGRVVGT